MTDRQQAQHQANLALRSMGHPNSVAHQFDFWNDSYEGRRLFSEVLGTFFLVLVAVGGGMVNARFGGDAVPYGAKVVSPALMVLAIILFMGTVSGAHLNPAVTLAFAARGDFPWRRVPAYVVAQFARGRPGHPAAVGDARQAGQCGADPAGERRLRHDGDAVGDRPDHGAGQRDPGHRIRRPADRAARRHRRGQLHRAGGVVGIAR